MLYHYNLLKLLIQVRKFFSVHEINKILSEYAFGWINYLINAGKSESYIPEIERKLNSFITEKELNKNED